MAKAKITLNDNGPKTYHWQGLSLEQGQNIVTTLDDVILHFQSQPGFTVDILEGSGPKASPAPVEDDEPEEEDDDDGDDDGEEADGLLTAKDLKKQNKTALLQLAEERGVKADVSMKVADIAKAILADQEAKKEG